MCIKDIKADQLSHTGQPDKLWFPRRTGPLSQTKLHHFNASGERKHGNYNPFSHLFVTMKKEMRTQLCYPEYICNFLPEIAFPCFFWKCAAIHTSENQITIYSWDEINTSCIGAFAAVPILFSLPGNNFDTLCPSAPAGCLPGGPLCLLWLVKSEKHN